LNIDLTKQELDWLFALLVDLRNFQPTADHPHN
jgi:hypothetical protein